MIIAGLRRLSLYAVAHLSRTASEALVSLAERLRRASLRALNAADPPPEWDRRLWDRDHDPRTEQEERRP